MKESTAAIKEPPEQSNSGRKTGPLQMGNPRITVKWQSESRTPLQMGNPIKVK